MKSDKITRWVGLQGTVRADPHLFFTTCTIICNILSIIPGSTVIDFLEENKQHFPGLKSQSGM
jgi:hypothetical protein